MKEYSVEFLPDHMTIIVAEGTTILQAALKAGMEMDSPCGGRGTCGKCAVKILTGRVVMKSNDHGAVDILQSGFVLACQALVTENLSVEVPARSRIMQSNVLVTANTMQADLLKDGTGLFPFKPFIRRITLELNKPDIFSIVNDLDILLHKLIQETGYPEIAISLKILTTLPHIIREQNWRVTVYLFEYDGKAEIIDICPGKGTPPLGLAIDIGTTTVVVYLVNLDTGMVIDKEGDYNLQSIYGADVISRMIHCDEQKNGLNDLQTAVIQTINQLIETLCIKASICMQDIYNIVYAGNTVMAHLLLGIDPAYIRLEPYTPAATVYPFARAAELGIQINPMGYVVSLPSIASYVGGDIVAGVLAAQLFKQEQVTLFIDIGTNGELVLGNKEWLVTCACSAGPAFEGAGISCGVRAKSGAISEIEINDEQDVRLKTIDDESPIGICGSGMICAIAEMKNKGIIDRAGKFTHGLSHKRIRKTEEGYEYVLVFSEGSSLDRDISITENDIKNIIRSKGAIYAGIRTMLQMVSLDFSSISRVYIAGGFGNFINIQDAIALGLLPDLDPQCFQYLGNSSIQGALHVLLCQDAYKEAVEISKNMTYLELSIGNSFINEFVSSMFIPHTDLTLFPNAKNQRMCLR